MSDSMLVASPTPDVDPSPVRAVPFGMIAAAWCALAAVFWKRKKSGAGTK
jgi:hypothetical protein